MVLAIKYAITETPKTTRAMIKQLTQLKAYLFGFAIAIFAVSIYLVSDAYQLEEHFGLDTLFYFRGVEKAPSEVAIIALEKTSSNALDVPNNPVDWDRNTHVKLIEKLDAAGVKSIAFDLYFKRPKTAQADFQFSQSLQHSNKVVLVSHIQREIQVAGGDIADQSSHTGINIEKIIPPLELFADKAVAVAPFVLPKYPIKVSKFWTYRVPAGDIPNLPAVTLQLYSLDAYAWLRRQLQESLHINDNALPEIEELLSQKLLVPTMITLRSHFRDNSQLADQLLQKVEQQTNLEKNIKLKIRALIGLYDGPNRYYLNFYGPPWTITTIPYHQALSQPVEQLELKDKVVFVGFSERLQPEQKDNFNTVYSQSDGLDLSGVEIAATAFANLLHQRTVTPIEPQLFLFIVFLYGFVISFLSRGFKPAIAIIVTGLIAGFYLLSSAYLFQHDATWLPWVVPILFITPLTLFIAVSWHYYDEYQDRKRIRAAFGMYLPDNVINEISKQRDPLAPYQKVMYGIVLATDAADYTQIAETMTAGELGELMNQYYELLFRPVKNNNGIVCDVVGDAMMAIWSASEVNVELRQKACLAAIDIKQSLGLERNKTFALPTRIGLHAGEVALANVGAIDHYEYRAVGDIVNTASRIEGFNKQLGTRCLASAEVIEGTTGLLKRELGTFTLAGKTRPITLHEIIMLEQDAKDSDYQLCDEFTKGITAYRNGNIQDANGIFTQLINQFPNDGPTRFYVQLCRRVAEQSGVTTEWDSVIAINTK